MINRVGKLITGSKSKGRWIKLQFKLKVNPLEHFQINIILIRINSWEKRFPIIVYAKHNILCHKNNFQIDTNKHASNPSEVNLIIRESHTQSHVDHVGYGVQGLNLLI